MSAVAIIRDLQSRGAELRVDGVDLRIRAAKGIITPDVADTLRRHKAELVRLLRPGAAWDAVDWRAFYDERAAIAEHDGGMPRAKAERMAWEACLVEWQRLHTPSADPASCAACGALVGNSGADPLVLSDGATVHVGCHDAYVARRRSEAENALSVVGVSR